MRNPGVIHEEFMNGSRMIPPRVGVGVGVRGGVGLSCVSHASLVPTNRPGNACRFAESRCGR